MIFLCKWIHTRSLLNSVSEFFLAVNTATGEIEIKTPVLYDLTLADDFRQLTNLLQAVHSRLTESLGKLYLSLDMAISLSAESTPTPTLLEKARLSMENFGLVYWHSRMMNIYLYICSESTHEEKFVRNEL